MDGSRTSPPTTPSATPHSPRTFNFGNLLTPRRARANTAGSLGGTGSPVASPSLNATTDDPARSSFPFPSSTSTFRPRNGNYIGLQLNRRNTAQGEAGATSQLSSSTPTNVGFLSNRSRSRSESLSLSQSQPSQQNDSSTATASASQANTGMQASISDTNPNDGKPFVKVRLVPHLEINSRSLHFDPIVRNIKPGSVLKIGRFNERSISAHPAARTVGTGDGQFFIPGGPNDVNCARATFKSKVVSRSHAEVALDAQSGVFSIRDTSSSSGSFLNHVRLSGPGLESRWHPLRDGDILQLGVDYQGGTEEMYRCVKIKVEIDRKRQKGSQFSTAAFKQLRAMHTSTGADKASASIQGIRPIASTESTDCCICLFSVGVCQSLFIAPCSHVYHYKCIRPLLQMHYPGFSCPLCRTFADLEADVDEEQSFMEPEDAEDALDNDDVVEEIQQQLQQTLGLDAHQPVASTSNHSQTMTENNASDPFRASASPSHGDHSRDSGAQASHHRSSRRSSVASRRSHSQSHLHASASHPMPEDMPVPDAGEFQSELRRGSINVSGPHGHASPIAFTGRTSRPGSMRNFDMTGSPAADQRNRSKAATSVNGMTPPALPGGLPSALVSPESDDVPTAVQPNFAEDVQQAQDISEAPLPEPITAAGNVVVASGVDVQASPVPLADVTAEQKSEPTPHSDSDSSRGDARSDENQKLESND